MLRAETFDATGGGGGEHSPAESTPRHAGTSWDTSFAPPAPSKAQQWLEQTLASTAAVRYSPQHHNGQPQPACDVFGQPLFEPKQFVSPIQEDPFEAAWQSLETPASVHPPPAKPRSTNPFMQESPAVDI